MKYTDLAWDNHLFIKKDAIKIHRKINIDYESAQFSQELYRTVEFQKQQLQ